MKYKIGGGGRLQPYDEEDGQYTDMGLEMQGNAELGTLIDVCEYPPTSDTDKTISFPSKDKHSLSYYKKFVEYVGRYRLYGEAGIDDKKIGGYLFVPQDKDDKSKFMIGVLGYPNDEHGWNKVRNEILSGTNFKTMRYEREYIYKFLTIAADTYIHDANGKIYLVKTSWRLYEDMTLKFVTLIPGGNKNG